VLVTPKQRASRMGADEANEARHVCDHRGWTGVTAGQYVHDDWCELMPFSAARLVRRLVVQGPDIGLAAGVSHDRGLVLEDRVVHLAAQQPRKLHRRAVKRGGGGGV
jgi:hypothetical protein